MATPRPLDSESLCVSFLIRGLPMHALRHTGKAVRMKVKPYGGARMQPLSTGSRAALRLVASDPPRASKLCTHSDTVHPAVQSYQLKRRRAGIAQRVRPVRLHSTYALLAARRRHGVQVRKQLSGPTRSSRNRAEVMALMQPIICCVRVQSAREFVTEFSGGATPHRSGVAQS